MGAPCVYIYIYIYIYIYDISSLRVNKCGTTLAHPAAVNESKVQGLKKAHKAI